MAVKQVGEIFVCKICGNVVEVVKVGGGTLVCCGQDMVLNVEEKEANSRISTTHLGDAG